jgi:uncharacterized protein (DUF433 family)
VPDNTDLLDQFLELPADRQEKLTAHLFEALGFPFPLHILFRYRQADFPSIVSTPNVCGGSSRLIRTRIPVWILYRMRQLDFSESKILECYPTLTAADLVQAWRYAALHKAEIEKEIQENERD